MILDGPEHVAVAAGRRPTTAPSLDGWGCAIPAVRITKVVGLAVGQPDGVLIQPLQGLPSAHASPDKDWSHLEHPLSGPNPTTQEFAESWTVDWWPAGSAVNSMSNRCHCSPPCCGWR